MLPAGSRLRHRADFAATLRRARGTRANGLVVVHVTVPGVTADVDHPAEPGLPQVGFVVSRAVGPAVVRNRVKRRLRHLLARRLGQLPRGACVVVRALPPSATASFTELDAAVGRALQTGLARARSAPVTR